MPDRPGVARADPAKHPEIGVEPSPDYVPKAGPDEPVWGHTEYGRLSSFAPEDTAELRAVLVEELERLDRRPDLLGSFIRQAGVRIRLSKPSR